MGREGERMRCKVCKRRFTPKKENRYTIIKQKDLSEKIADLILNRQQMILECFDCPKCGCQNLVNIREADMRGEKSG